MLHQKGAGFLLHAVGAVLVGPPAAGRDAQEEGGRRPRRRGGKGPHDQRNQGNNIRNLGSRNVVFIFHI